MNYTEQLAHLIWIAQMDKAFAWARAQEMAADNSGLWKGMAEDLKREMLARKSSDAAQKNGG